MAITIINPNSTASMTDAMLSRVRATAPMLDWLGITSHEGPPAIQGAVDGLAAEGPLLELIGRADREGADAIIIGCFDDTALARAKSISSCPVIGIGEASYALAGLLRLRFSVVTTTLLSVPVIEDNIVAQGFGDILGRVRASGVEVLELEHDPSSALPRIEAEGVRALHEDDISCLVAGCAGMVAVTDHLRKSLSCRIIDPLEAAAKIAFALV